ncbi:putative importin 11 [Xylariaceae sp. FL0016]|nr:putative importin 11 [Xylariaceae sp. FL0016]
MDFAIEVPGAATPLSQVELCRTLQSASSHDYSKRQAAGQQLSSWEDHADFYPALQAVFLDNKFPREIRLLAIIQLKNGVDRHWRQHSIKKAIQPAEKHAIRTNLVRGTVNESDRQLALHNALVVAKIVRIDFPQEWPNALNDIITHLRDGINRHDSVLPGGLLLLLQIVKELGSARLRKSQTALQSATPELVHILGQIYDTKSTAWIASLNSGTGNESELAHNMEISLLAFKILRRLLIVGYEFPHKDKTVREIWAFSQKHFGQFLGFIHAETPTPKHYLDTVGKHLLQFTKLHVEMAEQHSGSFASLPSSVELVRAYWDLVAKFAEIFDKSGGIRQGGAGDTKSKTEGPLIERVALKGLLLMRSCMRMVHRPRQTIRYRSKEDIIEQQQAISYIKTELFTDDVVKHMANTIITHLLIFRQSDWEAWQEEPQEWEQQEESQGNAYEWEVRPCAEKLFLDILTHHKELLLAPLLSYFATCQAPGTEVVAKEAVYTAMGLAAPIVQADFDFDSILKSAIKVDAQYTGDLCQVMRRRIAILVSEWVPITIGAESRPLVYEIFRHFLNPDDPSNDIVVQITAARQFKPIVDEFGFDGEMFSPFASDVLQRLVNLLTLVDIDETKLAILETTRSLIQRMDSSVNQYGDFIMKSLPEIWASAGELNFMMKQAVLTIMQTLVMSMKTPALRYEHMMLPLITEATHPESELYLYLMDEALELWSSILSQGGPPLSTELLSLSETAIRILADQNEHAFNFMSIVGSYIILAPGTMLEDRMRQPLFTALAACLDSKSRELMGVLTKYVEAYMRFSYDLGGAQGFRLIVQDMMETGFLRKIFEGIHDAYECHQTSGPNARHSRVGSLTLTDYFMMLSRIAVVDPAIFVEVLASMGPLDGVWTWLSAEWFGNFDRLADVCRQKLNLLAMTRLMELCQPMQDLVLQKLQDYFSMWTSVMVQILDPDSPGNDQLVNTSEPVAHDWETPKDVLERQLFSTDPINTVQSLPYIKERLHALAERVGGEQAFQDTWAVNVDREILQGFQALGVPHGHEL